MSDAEPVTPYDVQLRSSQTLRERHMSDSTLTTTVSITMLESLIESNRRALGVSHQMIDMNLDLVTKLIAGRRPRPRDLVQARLSVQALQTALEADDAALEAMTATLAELGAEPDDNEPKAH